MNGGKGSIWWRGIKTYFCTGYVFVQPLYHLWACGEIGIHAGLRYPSARVRVQVPPSSRNRTDVREYNPLGWQVEITLGAVYK